MNQQKQSRLFKLPAELRNNVYELAIASPVAKANGTVELTAAADFKLPPLLLTCKMVTHEGSGIAEHIRDAYWQNTTFTTTDVETYEPDAVSPSMINKVQRLIILRPLLSFKLTFELVDNGEGWSAEACAGGPGMAGTHDVDAQMAYTLLGPFRFALMVPMGTRSQCTNVQWKYHELNNAMAMLKALHEEGAS